MIKRSLFSALKAHLDKPEISLLVGPRQAGKTTLMLMLKKQLEQDGKKTAYFNLDNENDKRFFTSQAQLIKKIELEIGKTPGVVFIDEMQRKEEAGIFLKGIYDLNLPYKMIVSGSGSLELKEKIHESLAGRKRFFEVGTLSFDEFVNHKTDYKYEDKLSDFFVLEREKTAILLNEYLNFGGYPRVVLEDTEGEKRKNIDEIVRSYLEKDIAYFLKVEKIDAYFLLMKLLSGQIGQIANNAKLSSQAGVAQITFKNYLWYAQKTFVVRAVTPYFKNIRKEISKAPVFYFDDLGFCSYLLGEFGSLTDPRRIGLIFQNLIFNILTEKLQFTGCNIHFWRTKDKSEVDFVIDLGKKIVPVEVKYRKYTEPKIETPLRNFIDSYAPDKAFIVNLDFDGVVKINNTSVVFVPFFKWLTGGEDILAQLSA